MLDSSQHITIFRKNKVKSFSWKWWAISRPNYTNPKGAWIQVNTSLYSGRIRLKVSAENDEPSAGPITRIRKELHFTNIFQLEDLNLYKLILNSCASINWKMSSDWRCVVINVVKPSCSQKTQHWGTDSSETPLQKRSSSSNGML